VQYKQTLGVDFFLKHIVLPGDVHVALSIWDIGGQQIGSNMIGNYIYGAQAVILTYDLTNYQSFQNLEDWLELVEKVADKDEPPYIVLCANKSDLKHNPAVQTSKHNRSSDENCNISFYVSAKTGSGVAPMFNRIAADLSGYVLTKAELEQSSAVLPAVIVNHQQHDPNLPHIDLNKKQKSKCAIQ
jgi:Ras-related protein Rab-28